MKAIMTKLLHQTQAHPNQRILAKDEDGNRVIFTPEDFTFKPDGDHHEAAAKALCKKMNWTGELVKGSTGPGQWVFCFYPKDGPLLVGCQKLIYLFARHAESLVQKDGEQALQSDIARARRAILNAGAELIKPEPWE